MLLNYQIKKARHHDIDCKTEIIFLLHGLFGSFSNLGLLARELNVHHDIVLIDLRNHGQSPQSTQMSYPDMVADIFFLADHLQLENFSIVGHSMGGKLAMACALTEPQRINRLVIADISPVAYPDKHSNVFAGLKAINFESINTRQEADKQLQQHVEMAEVRSFLLKSLRKTTQGFELLFNLETLSEQYNQIRDWPYQDQTFNKKILFIKGGDSDYIQATHQAFIMQQFPQAKVKIMANCGHWLHVQKAKTFNRLVAQFFQ